MSEAHDWRRDRDEWIADALLDDDERADWEQQRNVDLGLEISRPSTAEMVERWAVERRAVEDRCEIERIAERAAIEQWRRDRRHARRVGGSSDAWEAQIWADEREPDDE